jgi:hypothetical protein
MGAPFSLHPCQHLLLLVFLIMTIPTGVRWNLSVVLICISFMARDGEYFFMCFLERKEILTYAVTWMQSEYIAQSEISHSAMDNSV